MKKNILLVVFLLLTILARAQYVNIPDKTFRDILKSYYPSCMNDNNMLDTTCSKITSETYLYLPLLGDIDLEGIQYFKSLQALSINSTNITSTPPLPTSLTVLTCHNSKLPGSLTLPTSLKILDWRQSGLTSLPLLPDSLVELTCGFNALTSLPDLPATLTLLSCDHNQLSSLPPLPSALQHLVCGNNKLTRLPDLPSGLSTLNCSWNSGISELPALQAALYFLHCNNLSLTSLPPLPGSLGVLNCAFNQLTDLPALPPSLYTLNCASNLLSSLPTLPAFLQQLYCYSNNIYCLPRLPMSLKYIAMDTTKIRCLYNHVNDLYLSKDEDLTDMIYSYIPVCDEFNTNGCSTPALIKGSVFFDHNSNGIMDAGDITDAQAGRVKLSDNLFNFITASVSYGKYRVFVPGKGHYQLTMDSLVMPANYTAVPALSEFMINGDTTIIQDIALQPTFAFISGKVFYDLNSNGIKDDTENYRNSTLTLTKNPGTGSTFCNTTDGHYYFTTDSLGSYTISIDEISVHYKAIPATSITFNFTHAGTIINQDIALQPLDYIDELTVAAQGFYVCGYPYPYPSTMYNVGITDIKYQNTGTSTISPVITINYDSSKIKIDSTSYPGAVFTDSSIIITETNLHPGSIKNLLIYFTPDLDFTICGFYPYPDTLTMIARFNTTTTSITDTIPILLGGIIPLKIISFDGYTNPDGTVNVTWQTANEINVKNYTVEQSPDGRNFTDIDIVTAKANAYNAYSYKLAKTNTAFVFLRLRITAKNGQISYSKVVQLRNKNAKDLIVLNNPVRNQLIIRNDCRSLINTIARIINSQGIVVKEFTCKQGSQMIDVSILPPGLYFVQLNDQETKKIIISR